MLPCMYAGCTQCNAAPMNGEHTLYLHISYRLYCPIDILINTRDAVHWELQTHIRPCNWERTVSVTSYSLMSTTGPALLTAPGPALLTYCTSINLTNIVSLKRRRLAIRSYFYSYSYTLAGSFHVAIVWQRSKGRRLDQRLRQFTCHTPVSYQLPGCIADANQTFVNKSFAC